MLVDRKRVPNIFARKYKGRDKNDAESYVLLYYRNRSPGYGRWIISLRSGGKSACSVGDGFDAATREVSYREMPEAIQRLVKAATDHMRKHGDPIDNDISIFAPPRKTDKKEISRATTGPHGRCTPTYCAEHEVDSTVRSCLKKR